MKKAVFLTLLCIFCMHTSPVHADLAGSDVTVTTLPEIPGANETVVIKLGSYAIDLSRASIVWSVDGKTALSGTGVISYTVKTGAIGSQTTVTATITNAGSSVTKTVILQPSGLDLLWQAVDSHVPPFYRGKAMPSSEAVIKVVAMPQIKVGGKMLGTSDLTFSWQRNFDNYPDFSGFAKDNFAFKASYLNTKEIITGKATAVATGTTATKTLTLTTGTPQILFYAYNPLLGIQYNHELGNSFSLTTDEATFVAEPYFFSPANARSSDLHYTWKLNGSNIATPATKNWLVVKKPEGIAGTAYIDLSIDSIPHLFQSAKKSLSVTLK